MDERCYHFNECMTMFRDENKIIFGNEVGEDCDECLFRQYLNEEDKILKEI